MEAGITWFWWLYFPSSTRITWLSTAGLMLALQIRAQPIVRVQRLGQVEWGQGSQNPDRILLEALGGLTGGSGPGCVLRSRRFSVVWCETSWYRLKVYHSTLVVRIFTFSIKRWTPWFAIRRNWVYANNSFTLRPLLPNHLVKRFCGGETRWCCLNQHDISTDMAKLFTYFSTVLYSGC